MPPLPIRRRVVLLVLVSLLAGAIANVTIAWASLWLPAGRPLPSRRVSSSKWDAPVPRGWPAPQECYITYWPGHVSRLSSTAEGDYLQGVIQCGWPAPSMHGWQLGWVEQLPAQLGGGAPAPATQDARKDEWLLYLGRPCPLRPMWLGFLINTLLYACVLCALVLGPGLIRRFARRRRGVCPFCGYDLRGLADVVCPECGSGR